MAELPVLPEDSKSTGSGGTGGTGGNGGGTGGFLRDLMSTLDDEESSHQTGKETSEDESSAMNITVATDDVTMETVRESVASSLAPDIILPPINDQRQTMFSPTPKDMVVHLPNINLKKLNKAWNNSIESGGASPQKKGSAGPRSPKKSASASRRVSAQIEQIVEEQSIPISKTASTASHAKRRATRKDTKKGVDFTAEDTPASTNKRQPRKASVGRRRTISGQDLKRSHSRGSNDSTGSQPKRTQMSRRRSSGSSHGGVERNQPFKHAKQAQTSKFQTVDSEDSEDDETDEHHSRPQTMHRRASTKKGKKKKAVWRGWDTGRLAPHKLRKLPDFVDLAPQIGKWVNDFMLKQPNFSVQPVPLNERESDNYVRDYLAVKGISEIFELMTQALLMKRPDEPLEFLIEFSHVMACQLADVMGEMPCCKEHKVALGDATLPFRAANSAPSYSSCHHLSTLPGISPPEPSALVPHSEGDGGSPEMA